MNGFNPNPQDGDGWVVVNPIVGADDISNPDVAAMMFYVRLSEGVGNNLLRSLPTQHRYNEIVYYLELRNAGYTIDELLHQFGGISCSIVHRYNLRILHDGTRILVSKNNHQPEREVMYLERLYHVLYDIHVSFGHCNQERLHEYASGQYSNITRLMCHILVNTCHVCRG